MSTPSTADAPPGYVAGRGRGAAGLNTPDFGTPPPGYVAGRGRGAVGLNTPDFGTPPPGYVAGRGRGAAPLTHRKNHKDVASMDVEMTDGPNVFGTGTNVSTGATAVPHKVEVAAADSRARRLHLRTGGRFTKDVREDQGCDFDAPDRKAETDMGYKIEPFNMRREKTEGHFDEDGMYIEHKEDMKKLRDAWLDTVDEGLTTAKIAPEHVKKLSAEQKKLMDSKLVYEKLEHGEESDDGVDNDQPVNRIDCRPLVYEVCLHLMPLETPNRALQRLKKGSVDDGKFVLRKKKKPLPPMTAATPSASTAPRSKKRLTEWGYDDQPEPKRLNESDTNGPVAKAQEPDMSRNAASTNGTDPPAASTNGTDPPPVIATADSKEHNGINTAAATDSSAVPDEDDFVSGLLSLDASKPTKVEADIPAKSPFDRLTELCDLLLQQEMYDIYTTTRENLSAALLVAEKQTDKITQQYVVSGNGPFWQYKFGDTEQWYGPFDSGTMLSWKQHLEKKVQVRCVSATGEPQEDIVREYESIDFALYM